MVGWRGYLYASAHNTSPSVRLSFPKLQSSIQYDSEMKGPLIASTTNEWPFPVIQPKVNKPFHYSLVVNEDDKNQEVEMVKVKKKWKKNKSKKRTPGGWPSRLPSLSSCCCCFLMMAVIKSSNTSKENRGGCSTISGRAKKRET